MGDSDDINDSAEKAYAAAAADLADKPRKLVEPAFADLPMSEAAVAAEPAMGEPVDEIVADEPIVEVAPQVAAVEPPAEAVEAAAPRAKKSARSRPVEKAPEAPAEPAAEPVIENAQAPAPDKAPAPAARRAAAEPATPKSSKSPKDPTMSETTEKTAEKTAEKIKSAADKAKGSAEEFSARVQDAVKDAQAKAKAAFDKNKDRLSDLGEFTKGNLEAVRESGKILVAGVKNLGKTYVEETKANLSTIRADVQELRGVKSPSEFVKLQGTLVRKYFDNAVAANSKQSEAVLKLANEALQPISSRVSLALDKVKKAA